MAGTVTFNYVSIISAVSLIVGGLAFAIYILKKNGIVTLGKAKERRVFTDCDKCSGHSALAQNVASLKAGQTIIVENVAKSSIKIDESLARLNILSSKLGEHLGYHRGKREKILDGDSQ